jgi:two-component system, NtrC family, response regulator GlrR
MSIRGDGGRAEEERDHRTTLPCEGARQLEPPSVRRFRLTVVEGPGSGATVESTADRCAVGSDPLNDLLLADETVSRFHCEIRAEPGGVRVRDLESLNGVVLDGVQVTDAFLRGGSLLRLGRTTVRFDLGVERNRLPLSESIRFGGLVGSSIAMRACFALLERAAGSDVTVLLEGETGIGKSRAARAIHEESARRGQPFLIVDCGAIPANLLESELFGHEKGAFTGAATRRVGAFEEAAGGTIFLDEVGELPTELQPKLLRVIEEREVRRLGANRYFPVDVRIVAATNRNLRAEVNAGRFRSDLFFRLAVLRVPIPALRERTEDIPVIASELLRHMGALPEQVSSLHAPETLNRLRQFAWPGNVRELRNYLERCLVFEEALPVSDEAPVDEPEERIDPHLPYAEARRRALERFERRYLRELLELHGGKVSQAASAAEIDRVYLYRLIRRHNLKDPAAEA